MKKGILILNLGTPDSPKVKDVSRYLAQFLSDPRVIDIPAVFRYLLLAIILLTRPRKSAKAYSKIWSAKGSPLLMHANNLCSELKSALGENYQVELGMRYGKPSIKSAIELFIKSRVEQVFVIPLFPQYASSSYGSALAKVYQCLSKHDYVIPVKVIPAYYARTDYINALSEVTKQQMQDFDYMLMSFHGLPERHVIRSDGGSLPEGCDLRAACPKICQKNFSCYRAQCYTTARLLAENLSIENYGVSFQSRLGRTPWIQPYTEDFLTDIFAKGHKKLAVVCPSFAADCLETYEEIGMELKKQWLEIGGTSFQMINCLNSESIWVETIKNWINKGLVD